MERFGAGGRGKGVQPHAQPLFEFVGAHESEATLVGGARAGG